MAKLHSAACPYLYGQRCDCSGLPELEARLKLHTTLGIPLPEPEPEPAYTLAQVLVWLPVWMRADFDCPNHGPHDWFPRVTSRGNHYTWCRNCNRRKTEYDPSELSALEVIASWL